MLELPASRSRYDNTQSDDQRTMPGLGKHPPHSMPPLHVLQDRTETDMISRQSPRHECVPLPLLVAVSSVARPTSGMCCAAQPNDYQRWSAAPRNRDYVEDEAVCMEYLPQQPKTWNPFACVSHLHEFSDHSSHLE